MWWEAPSLDLPEKSRLRRHRTLLCMLGSIRGRGMPRGRRVL